MDRFQYTELENTVPIEVVIVDQEIIKELQCGICLQIINKPRQCKNGHLFCMDCILQSLKKIQECPECRCSLNVEKLSRSLFVERHLRTLSVFCKYHFKYQKSVGWIVDEQGCNEIISLENSAKHENICEHSFEYCKFSKECGVIRRRLMDAHYEECPYRPVQCQHCNADFTHNEITNHLNECDMIKIECDRCNAPMIKKEFEKHKLNLCPNYHIQCPFFESGCNATFDRKDLESHIEKSLSHHLLLMKSHYTDTITNLKKEFSLLLKDKDDKIKQLEKSMNEKSDSSKKVEWCVKNYSILKKKGYIQSEKFTIGGFQWFIGFYTDGDSNDSKGYISIYLFLDTNQIPKGKSLTLEYYLKFFNQRDQTLSVKKDFRTTFPIKGGQGWGDRKAIRASVLESNGFIKDDTLLVMTSILIKKTCWSIEESDS
ncbi:RGS-containing protein kinase [Heterostelium album PN500]|uniref:RGS-containing protein kinase n=1 Tax=Heterostelium pallidum (strain ATCC 26659 / Pp 5 / PN500) TaxID=670386 RepID=D3BF23_HETP5|nr:RGS-containing protein kinase [Heterostelium album PN500]EFA80504.1 RGS-containing protein kinase [Heterostelium album PN500]|eukprot:XP_020432624.1 RGS-containing protein kinase [Heterostelium album PN500]